MSRRSGASRRRRRAAAIVVALALAVVGCGGDGSDSDDAAPTPTTSTAGEASDGEAPGATPSDAAAGSTTSTTLAEGEVAVPVDAVLAERMPVLGSVEPTVSDRVGFDERLCDGEKAPALPVGQARASYELSDDDVLTIAAYRFPPEAVAYYAAVYAEAVQGCARDATEGEVVPLGALDGVAYGLTTDRGEAILVLARSGDVMWVLLQESAEGPAEAPPGILEAFAGAVSG